MPDIDTALADTRWALWPEQAIAADASARRYVRRQGPAGDSVVVMDSGPIDTSPFVAMSAFLLEQGLRAPRVLLDRSPVLVLSDLGEVQVAEALDDGAAPGPLCDAILDVLIALHHGPQLPWPAPNAATLGEAVAITADYYAPSADAAKLSALMADAMSPVLAALPARIALRDFHAENIIWRADKTGTDRVGLLDFQDATMMPAGYDLVSLIRDVRRAMPKPLAHSLVARFCKETDLDPTVFSSARAVIAAQRNLRILGVFARLIRDEGKPGYARHLPRCWHLLKADLGDPALADLRRYIAETFPSDPTAAGFPL